MFDEMTTDKSGQPQHIAPARAFSPVLNRNILALDLATRTGWALMTRDRRVLGGCESFVPRAGWDPGQRGLRFKTWLQDLLHANDVHMIAYEAVVRHGPGNMAATAHLYGLLEGLVWMLASSRQIQVTQFVPTVIKKRWTGWGDASKEAMVNEAKRRGFRPVDDNHADALAILDLAVAEETDGAVRLGDGSMPDPAAAKRIERKKKAARPQGALI